MLGSPTITVKGRNLLAKIVAAKIPLTLSNIGLGDGLQEENEDVISLANEIMKKEIESCEYNEKEGQYYIRRVFTNAELEEGFYIREVGIYAIDPDEGEILYAYTNAGEAGVDYFAPGKGKVIVKEIIEMATKFGNAENITVVIDPSTALVTEKEFEEYKKFSENNINNLQKQITSNYEDIAQLSNPNLLINGGFDVWQRGKEFEFVDKKIYCADRWRMCKGNFDVGGKVYKLNNELVIKPTDISRNADYMVDQVLEGIENLKEKQLIFSIQCRVKSKVNIHIAITYINSSNESKTLNYYTDDIENTKKQLSITAQIPEEAIMISAFVRAKFYGNSENDFVALSRAKLEIGDKATPFYPRSFEEELSLCKRYFQIIKYQGVAISQDNLIIGRPYKNMRITPTPTFRTDLMTHTNTYAGSVENIGDLRQVNIHNDYIDNYVLVNKTLINGHIYQGFVLLDAEIY